MQHKPDYNRLLKTIGHEEPDCVPVAELGINRPVQEVFLGRKVKTIADEVDFWHKAGYDYMYQRANYEFGNLPSLVASGTRIAFESFEKEHSKSEDMMNRKGEVTTMAEFEGFDWPDPETVDDTPLDEIAKLLPEGMGIITGVGGIFTRAWMLMGFECFSMGFYDNPELVEVLFERVGRIQCAVLRRLVKKDRVFAVWYGDDLGYTEALMISPAILRKHVFPWIEEIAKITHDAGMPLIMHSDGKLTDLLDDLVALGLDALHPIEPKAMDIRELKRTYGDRLALFGNVDLNVLGLGTTEETKQLVHELICDIAPGGGYALGSSCSISSQVKIENYRAMLEATFEYGQYPISC